MEEILKENILPEESWNSLNDESYHSDVSTNISFSGSPIIQGILKNLSYQKIHSKEDSIKNDWQPAILEKTKSIFHLYFKV